MNYLGNYDIGILVFLVCSLYITRKWVSRYLLVDVLTNISRGNRFISLDAIGKF